MHLPHSNSAPGLVSAFEDQDDQFSSAFAVIREAIVNRAFPGASIAVTHSQKLVSLKSFGLVVYEKDLEGAPFLPAFGRSGDFEIGTSTLFDLASLTKPIATATMAMILYERGQLNLDAPISGTVPEFTRGNSDSRRRTVTFRHLLGHSSGLPAYEKLFLKAHTRDELLHSAFTTTLTADPGSRAEYSDIGFIILGTALERLAAESLADFCQREIFGPFGMSSTTFNPPPEVRPQIPPTADERQPGGADPTGREMYAQDKQAAGTHGSTFRNRVIQGEVQDENAFVLGGVAGHAGLFSAAGDLARFAQVFLSGGAPILRPETLAIFTAQQSSPPGSTRTLGWDTPSNPSQSGRHFGPRSYGHLGYTGTSLWIDPDRQVSITLLTNRTWPDCSNQAIKQVRPRVHDAIVEALL